MKNYIELHKNEKEKTINETSEIKSNDD